MVTAIGRPSTRISSGSSTATRSSPSSSGILRAMPLADFLGWDKNDWDATLGLAGVFFVFFPLLVNGLIVFIIAQALGERTQNQAYARGEDLDASSG